MTTEFPDAKQRAVVCHKSWDDSKQTSASVDRRPDKYDFLAGQNISSINSENRTVDVVFFTGVDVPRMNWFSGEKYILRFDPAGADLSLLNNGAPVLDNHTMWRGSSDQKGRVERAWSEGGRWLATLRFSKRPEIDGLWRDIEDRIVTKFSMGVEFLKTEKLQEKDQAILLAKEWRPFELSIAPIPADFGTTTLSAEPISADNSGILTKRAIAQEDFKMSDETKDSAGTARADALSIIEDQKRAAKEAGALAELSRSLTILEICKALVLPAEYAERHIREGTDLDRFRKEALEEQVRRVREGLGVQDTTRPPVTRMVRDEVDTRRKLMGDALFGMMNPKERKEDAHNPFLRLSVKQIAEESVKLQHNMRGPVPMQDVATLAMQTTADFASVLETTSRKQLLAMYAYANPTYKVWTKRSTTPDFKTMTRVRLSETPEFLKVPEGAAITIGLMSDAKESYSLATYGRGISFTRQMLINDDLGAFNDLIGQFGVQAARLENKVVYAILNTNANMADGVALFYATTHINLGTGVLGNTAFDAAFASMAIQKGPDGKSVLNLTPKYLIVPKAKESTARAATMLVGPNVKASDQNWFAGRLEVVADAELDGTSTTVWYMAADPNFAPGIEYCHLEGAEGPQFVRKDNEQGVLGIQFYGYLDFAAKAVDWRPLFKSSGA